MEPSSLHRRIIESSPDGIWVVDLDGRTLYANETFARMYGVSLAEIGSITVFDTLDDTGKAQFAEHLADVRAGRANQGDVEVLFHDVHGTPTWMSVRESLLHEGGDAVAIVNRVYGYADRRRVLDELRTSREALREAQQIARIGSWHYDLATGRVEMLGGHDLAVALDGISGPEALLTLIHPDDVAQIEEAVGEAVAHGGEFELDVRLSADAGWTHLRVHGVVHLDANGTPATMTGTHQDVTEMRQVELALRDEVNQSALMRRVAAAANAAHSLTEVLAIVRPLLAHHDDWIRSAAFRVDDAGALTAIDRDVRPEEEALCRAALRSTTPVWSDDRRSLALRVGTAERAYAVGTITAARPLERSDLIEVMAEAVAVQLARVAEREESERSLAAARDAAMAASRQKSEFLATMSHEIRTPLNGIIGLTDLLQRTALDAEQQRLASGLQAAGHTLLAVLNDVLDFSKLDGRAMELERVDVDVRCLVDRVAGVLSGAARAGGVELVVWCEPTVPAVVLGDPTRLSQVLMNLVSNAIKFSAQGEVLIRVSTSTADDERVCLDFDVVDNGIGIDPEHLERLFEPFTQADASTTRRFGGTGLGLSIAREIVVAFGGDISYRPNPAGGCIFSFSLWCDLPPEGTADVDAYARSWLAGKRVLVADGATPRATALRDQLAWWQIEVDVAEDVPTATELLAHSVRSEQPYDAILIDARVPGGGGMVLAGDIAGDTTYDQVAMIVLGSDLEVDLDHLREVGVSVFLERPVSAETLRGTLLEQVAGVPSRPVGRPELTPQEATAPRILVVEDNVVNQLVASGLLASLGYRTEIAHNGADALDLLARERFDAVLMDVQMPVLDGYVATRTLREREPAGVRVPVIAMTAAAIAGERERCLAAGMDEFLTKPVDRAALAGVLDRLVGASGRAAASGDLGPTPPIEGLDTERLDMLRDIDPGDTSYIDRAIANFQRNSVAAEAAIVDLVAAGDAEGLRAVAHKIAGSALNLGISRAGEAARAVEHVADSGSTEGAAALLEELHAAMAAGREQLLAYQATYS